ncbi:MAG TPA: hypothetical protein VF721_04980 [Pyrinomonadaceae bacterium]|jgi:hypothetical protein
MKRRGFHQIIFLLAGVYNIGWGLFVALNPNWLFSFAGMEPINYPDVFACLGMVVGLYGIIYLEIARKPERGFLLAAVGLIGKILGPIGLALLIARGTWKPATIIMCVTNDFVWWIPFALYLRDSWAFYRKDLSRAG